LKPPQQKEYFDNELLLIAPKGIETISACFCRIFTILLIAPKGIETEYQEAKMELDKLLLIAPKGIETQKRRCLNRQRNPFNRT